MLHVMPQAGRGLISEQHDGSQRLIPRQLPVMMVSGLEMKLFGITSLDELATLMHAMPH